MNLDTANEIRLPLRGKTIRAADLFCGAGGSSTGAKRAVRELGGKLKLVAVNHWQTAIDTHSRMHPEAEHLCADLEHVRPRQAVPGGVLDLLIASPTCTYHSRARGGRPVHDQQRMDPWHVVRWCTDLRVHRLLVENVPEFVQWGACDTRTGRPMQSRKGEYFRAWCDALQSVGFKIDWRIIVCADFGDPTTRERFFLVGRSDRRPLRWPEPSHARDGGTDLLSTRARWRSAADDVIDWNIPGKSIFTRKKPLKPKTIRRIHAGAVKYGWPLPYVAALQALLDGRVPVLDVPAAQAAPFLLRLRGTSDVQVQASALPTEAPVPALTGGGTHVGLVMATGAGGAARTVDQPIPAVTAGGDGGARPHFIEPLLMGVGSSNAAKPVTDPVCTITTGGGSSPTRPGNARPQLIEPLVIRRNNGERGRNALPASEPLPTATQRGAGGIAQPVLTSYYGNGGGDDVDQPLPTVTTQDRFGVATPFLVPNFGENGAQAPRTHSVDRPLPAVCASGHIQLAEPLIVPVTHTARDLTPRTANSPLGTVTTAKGGELAMAHATAEPFVLPVTHHDGSDRTRSLDEPLPAVTGANRGELGLAQASVNSDGTYRIDILYRMLHWRELARAMSFDDEGEVYDFAGNSTEITKQIGNAVPGRTAKALIRALLDPLST